MEHQVYARYDMMRTSGARLLWNPGVVYDTGHSPNGENPGTFVGLVEGFGVAIGTGARVVTPSIALVWGRAERRHGATRIGQASQVFGTAGFSVGFRRRER